MKLHEVIERLNELVDDGWDGAVVECDGQDGGIDRIEARLGSKAHKEPDRIVIIAGAE